MCAVRVVRVGVDDGGGVCERLDGMLVWMCDGVGSDGGGWTSGAGPCGGGYWGMWWW